MLKKQKIEGSEPVVVRDEDSDMDMEPRSDEESLPTSEDEEDPEIFAEKLKHQVAWIAEAALKYYKEDKGEEYVFVDPIRSNAVLSPSGVFFYHSLFWAKKVVPSPASSTTQSSPATPKLAIGSSSSIPPIPEVSVNNDSGSTIGELFFAESAMYAANGKTLTVHYCVIIDTSGPDPPNIGCIYCSRSTKNPFYHAPKENLEFGKHGDEWDEYAEMKLRLPCFVPHRRSRKI